MYVIDYYDDLFSDLQGTQLYYEFIASHLKGHSILEFACGSGDLLNLFSKDYEIKGIDLDQSMLDKAVSKYPNLKDFVKQGNFLDYQDKQYDTLVCVGDSLNYMLDINDLEKFVENAVKLSNYIIVDCHHPYRLIEFETPYFEEGSTENFDYAYLITANDQYLQHQINFLDGQVETIVQWVFQPTTLMDMFKNRGYNVKVYTDFEYEGISDEGEKVFMIFEREFV